MGIIPSPNRPRIHVMLSRRKNCEDTLRITKPTAFALRMVSIPGELRFRRDGDERSESIMFR